MKPVTNEQGRSMVEMLGVLAIIGVIAVGALAGYAQAILKFRTARTADEIQTMSDDIFQTYSWMRTYPDKGKYLTVQDRLIADGVGIPDMNPFGGTYEVTTTNTTITISADGIPTDACTQLTAESGEWQNIERLGTCAASGTSAETGEAVQKFTITFL